MKRHFRHSPIIVLSLAITFMWMKQGVYSQGLNHSSVLDIGMRLELFIDDYLIETLEGAQLKLHTPQLRDVALRFDKPWEGRFVGYATVLQDDPVYRLYYRGYPAVGIPESQVTCYAESYDGIHWTMFAACNRQSPDQHEVRISLTC